MPEEEETTPQPDATEPAGDQDPGVEKEYEEAKTRDMGGLRLVRGHPYSSKASNHRAHPGRPRRRRSPAAFAQAARVELRRRAATVYKRRSRRCAVWR